MQKIILLFKKLKNTESAQLGGGNITQRYCTCGNSAPNGELFACCYCASNGSIFRHTHAIWTCPDICYKCIYTRHHAACIIYRNKEAKKHACLLSAAASVAVQRSFLETLKPYTTRSVRSVRNEGGATQEPTSGSHGTVVVEFSLGAAQWAITVCSSAKLSCCGGSWQGHLSCTASGRYKNQRNNK